jgi:hypothetical protein
MNLKNLNNFSTSRVKALLGLHPKVLADLLLKVLPELENRRGLRLAQRPDRKRPLLPKDGRPREVLPVYKVLMTLIYLRHNVTHEVVGALFDFSSDSSENAFHKVLPLLSDMFPSEKWESEKKWRRGEPSVGSRHPGPKADIKIYEEGPLPEPIADKPRLGDKAYSSKDHPEIRTPRKKPKGRELSEEQKAESKQIWKERVYVEHAIRRIKGWRIMRDEYRMATGMFAAVTSVVVGLIQLSRITLQEAAGGEVCLPVGRPEKVHLFFTLSYHLIRMQLSGQLKQE